MTTPDFPGPRLVELAGDRTEHELVNGEQIVGRGAQAHVVVDHDDVSRRHARLVVTDEVITVEDLGSKNGVFVNGVRINEATTASDGDRISLGKVELELVHAAADARRVLANYGAGVTVTRARDDIVVQPRGPGLLVPLLGVALFGALVAAMLLL